MPLFKPAFYTPSHVDHYSKEEMKIYNNMKGWGTDFETKFENLKTELQNHTVGSDLYQAGLAALIEARKIDIEALNGHQHLRLGYSLTLSLCILQNKKDYNYGQLLKSHVNERPLSGKTNTAKLESALLVLAGVAMLTLTLVFTPFSLGATFIAGTALGGSLIAMGLGLFAYRRSRVDPISPTLNNLAMQHKP